MKERLLYIFFIASTILLLSSNTSLIGGENPIPKYQKIVVSKLWLTGIRSYQKAENLLTQQKYIDSLILFKKAIVDFKEIKKLYPSWHNEAITYNIKRCEDSIDFLNKTIKKKIFSYNFIELYNKSLELYKRVSEKESKLIIVQDRLKLNKEKLKNIYQTKQEEIEKLKAKINNNIRHYKKIIAKKELVIKKLEKKINSYIEAGKKPIEELPIYKNAISQLMKYSKKNDKLMDITKKQREDISRLNDEIKIVKKELKNLKNKNNNITKKNISLSEELKVAKDNLKDLGISNSNNIKIISALEATIWDLESAISSKKIKKIITVYNDSAAYLNKEVYKFKKFPSIKVTTPKKYTKKVKRVIEKKVSKRERTPIKKYNKNKSYFYIIILIIIIALATILIIYFVKLKKKGEGISISSIKEIRRKIIPKKSKNIFSLKKDNSKKEDDIKDLSKKPLLQIHNMIGKKDKQTNSQDIKEEKTEKFRHKNVKEKDNLKKEKLLKDLDPTKEEKAKIKICPKCGQKVNIILNECPNCKYNFNSEGEKKSTNLANKDKGDKEGNIKLQNDICINCGVELPENAKKCPNCGAIVPDKETLSKLSSPK